MRAGARNNTKYSIPQTDGEEKGWNGDADRFFISRATACRGRPVPLHKFGFVGQAADGPVGARGPTTARFVGPDDPYPLCRCTAFPPDRGNRSIGPRSCGNFCVGAAISRPRAHNMRPYEIIGMWWTATARRVVAPYDISTNTNLLCLSPPIHAAARSRPPRYKS